MSAKSIRYLFISILVALAVWQFSSAGYIHAKAWLAQSMIKVAWAEAESTQLKVKPWPWADTYPVARIKSDRIDLDAIVLAGSSGRSLAFGPGHVSASSLPGSSGNIVIGGHRDTHFYSLKHTKVGDHIDLESADKEITRYEVTEIQVVDKGDGYLAQDFGDDRLTLITCYPFDSPVYGGPLRYVVIAKPIIDELISI